MVTNTYPICKLSFSLIRKLRYLEWLLLIVHLVLAATAGWSKMPLNLAIYSIFIIFSWEYPTNRSLRFRQAYILLAMVLIIGANFLSVSLDLLIYLYIAKSFFILGGKSTVKIAAIIGIAWIASEYFLGIQAVEQLDLMRFEPPFGFATYNLNKVFIFSLGLYVASTIFTIFLSSVVVAEQNSRKLAEKLTQKVEVMTKNLERSRISRDIHDSLGHTLTNLDIQLKVAQKLRDRDLKRAFQAIDTAAMLSAQCIEDVSHAIHTIRSDDFDLDRSLNNLIEQVRNDLALKIQWDINLPQLSLSTSHQIYCVVKEGLINIQKHADASKVLFQGYSDDKQIILKLEDDGVGFNLQQASFGFGLQGMLERVESINGKLELDSTPGKGTQITVIIPR